LGFFYLEIILIISFPLILTGLLSSLNKLIPLIILSELYIDLRHMKKIFKYFLKYLFSPAILVISILIFSIVIYKSEISFQGSLRSHYTQYIILAIILIALSVITFFLNYERKQNIFIMLLSITLTVYVVEFGLTLLDINFNKNQSKKEAFQKLGLKFDDRSRMEIYADLKKIDQSYVVTVPPHTYLKENSNIFPLSGISSSPTIYCNENGYYSTYKSDRYGFNNPDNIWNLDEIEYLVIGDSFAHGACVNRPNDLTSVLRNLSNSNILNLGYSGNGPLKELASLKEYLFLKKFKNVIWLFYPNDLNDLIFEYNNRLLKRYVDDRNFKQNLYLKQKLINKMGMDKILNAAIDAIKGKKNINILSYIKLTNLRKMIQFKSKKINPNFNKVINLANQHSNYHNSKFYFVYLPSYEEIKNEKTSSTYIEVKNLINQLNIPFIDIYSFIKNHKNKLEFFPSGMHGHYNEFGYDQVGNQIYNELSKF